MESYTRNPSNDLVIRRKRNNFLNSSDHYDFHILIDIEIDIFVTISRNRRKITSVISSSYLTNQSLSLLRKMSAR